ncbi:hypothetical protein SK128_012420 [Halocaridina rubra]|uniref:HTH psq-type domain-containing protein n=1 Tax=Halocaridina rubra TaxID=373956 RepID=A0AAN8XAX5_HALRR
MSIIIINRQEGRRFSDVGRHFGINESIVRYIKKDETNRKTASITSNKTAKRVVTPRNKIIVQMESTLALSIADCKKKNISLDTSIIQTKAKKLSETFATNEPNDDSGYREEEEEIVARSQLRLKGFAPDEVHNSAVAKAVKMAAFLGGEGFKDMTYEDEEQPEETHEEVEEPGLTLERLAAMYNMAKELQQLSQEHDNNMFHSVHFCNIIDDAMTPYKTIFAQKKK